MHFLNINCTFLILIFLLVQFQQNVYILNLYLNNDDTNMYTDFRMS